MIKQTNHTQNQSAESIIYANVFIFCSLFKSHLSNVASISGLYWIVTVLTAHRDRATPPLPPVLSKLPRVPMSLFTEPFGPQLPSRLCLCQNPAAFHWMFGADGTKQGEGERDKKQKHLNNCVWGKAAFCMCCLINSFTFILFRSLLHEQTFHTYSLWLEIETCARRKQKRDLSLFVHSSSSPLLGIPHSNVSRSACRHRTLEPPCGAGSCSRHSAPQWLKSELPAPAAAPSESTAGCRRIAGNTQRHGCRLCFNWNSQWVTKTASPER